MMYQLFITVRLSVVWTKRAGTNFEVELLNNPVKILHEKSLTKSGGARPEKLFSLSSSVPLGVVS